MKKEIFIDLPRREVKSQQGDGFGPLILTKYIGPTSYKSSRVKAYASVDKQISVTLNWNSGANTFDNHYAAALALCIKQGWNESPRFKGLRGANSEKGYGFVML